MPAAAACSQLLHYCEIVPLWQSATLALALGRWWDAWCNRAAALDVVQNQLWNKCVCSKASGRTSMGRSIVGK